MIDANVELVLVIYVILVCQIVVRKTGLIGMGIKISNVLSGCIDSICGYDVGLGWIDRITKGDRPSSI